MWHKLLSLCFIPFLFLTATRVSLSPQPATAGWCAGAGGCDMSWQHSNNPCKLTGWGVNANAKSTIEKWLKSISVSFISWCFSCWGIKGAELGTGDSCQRSFQHVFFFPSWEDLTLIVFQAAFYLPTATIIPHPNVWLLKIRTISTLAVFYVPHSSTQPGMHVCSPHRKQLLFHMHVRVC